MILVNHDHPYTTSHLPPRLLQRATVSPLTLIPRISQWLEQPLQSNPTSLWVNWLPSKSLKRVWALFREADSWANIAALLAPITSWSGGTVIEMSISRSDALALSQFAAPPP